MNEMNHAGEPASHRDASDRERKPVEPDEVPVSPVLPAARPFPTFENTPTLPHQTPGNGFESGRDSRAR